MTIYNTLVEFEKSNIEVKNVAKLGTNIPLSLSFVFTEKQLNLVKKNNNIIGLIGTKILIDEIKKINHIEYFVISEKVIEDFQYFYHLWSKKVLSIKPSKISKKALIHPSAIIDSYNVEIDDYVTIDPMVVVCSNTVIGKNSIIRSGTILGSEGFEVVDIKNKKIIPYHNGKLIIGNDVQIQAGCTVDKGIYGENTIIGDYTKVDNHVHIGHNTSIGKRCLITAGTTISGNVHIGSDVYIGPGSVISNRISIGNKARINIGSTVISDIKENDEVSGHFAENHRQYLKQKILLRKMLNKEAK